MKRDQWRKIQPPATGTGILSWAFANRPCSRSTGRQGCASNGVASMTATAAHPRIIRFRTKSRHLFNVVLYKKQSKPTLHQVGHTSISNCSSMQMIIASRLLHNIQVAVRYLQLRGRTRVVDMPGR